MSDRRWTGHKFPLCVKLYDQMVAEKFSQTNLYYIYLDFCFIGNEMNEKEQFYLLRLKLNNFFIIFKFFLQF